MLIPWFPAAPFSGITGRRNDPKRSAFHPEGKMNKAGSCTAATNQSSKMANKNGAFRATRTFTVHRFGAPDARLQRDFVAVRSLVAIWPIAKFFTASAALIAGTMYPFFATAALAQIGRTFAPSLVGFGAFRSDLFCLFWK
jgi:hypothetical protein